MVQKLRLQVALAKLGLASRRQAAEFIKAGRVKVKGQIVLEPGYRVFLASDSISVDNKTGFKEKQVYFMLNKPKGVVSTVKDRYARRKVVDLIRCQDWRVYPVGRLDKDTTGLLLLTNDGQLTYRLTHPKFGVKKVYHVCVRQLPSVSKLNRLEQGIVLEGQPTSPCRIRVLSKMGRMSRLEVVLTEGRQRQLKKMFAAIGHPVLSINRIALGPLKLANLPAGRWRRLNKQEIRKLKLAVEGHCS